MIYRSIPAKYSAVAARNGRGSALLSTGVVAAGLLCIAGIAHAQKAPTDDTILSWHGITVSGIVDLGLQYQPHAAPISDYYGAGGYNLIQGDSLKSVTGVTPNNLSASNITIAGKEPLAGDWSAVFRLQTLFNPNSGDLTDGLKSMTLNNGKVSAARTNGQDSDAAGQAFAGAALAGVSSPTVGTLTFGWQSTLINDGLVKYDPNARSLAFSLIGQSGTGPGAGATQDKRFKNSIKYVYAANGIHAGAMYKFSDGGSGTSTAAYQVQFGGEYAGLSVDAIYTKIYDAIAAAALTPAQLKTLLGTPGTLTTPGTPGLGYSASNSLSGTISDNTAYALLGSYVVGPGKIFAGYEHVKFANPEHPLAAGYVDIGGYVLAFVNNNRYTTDKNQKIYWVGVKWPVLPELELTAAFYGYKVDSWVAGTAATCSTTVRSNCSGTESVGSIDAVYHYSKRFDTYVGAMYSTVSDGLANGTIDASGASVPYVNRHTINPTVGVRFKF